MNATQQSLTWLIVEHLLTIAGFLLAVMLITQILRTNHRPAGALAWVMAIVLIPYVGVPLYLLIGGRKISRIVQEKAGLVKKGFGEHVVAAEPRCNAERLLIAAGMPATRPDNIVVLHHNGETAYTVMMELMREARHSIHAMTFILGRDDVGRSIVDMLAQRAREGVRVRLLLDGLGCIRSSGRFVQSIRDAGGQVSVFLPVLPLRRKWSANLRNHRKMVIADGEVALVGGMNLATSFMGPRPAEKRFVDNAVFIRGPAVADIDNIFADDWHYATDEVVPAHPPRDWREPRGHALVQVMASGPDAVDDTLHDAILTAIMEAQERVWVVTPYFVPDEAILNVLALQARMGRDVRILVPTRSNHRIADLARGPAVRHLAGLGAKIYCYQKGMLHAKALVFDHRLAITGSPNLDMRSMLLNFEIALFHYSLAEIEQTATWIEDLLEDSMPLEPKPAGIVREWIEGASMLASPLL
ncbi:MAG: PLDc N-terminal domain-containing protein [Candidatus Hydrogenedentes bacterium]|nr:PLDc N-terminal domain-containing protein [Candidatus Hydrogenedentota bacterium]MBI3117143.1 PLDc N-terminal domain-containing protein [Candidatus Hydrogenedentota bacterium]